MQKLHPESVEAVRLKHHQDESANWTPLQPPKDEKHVVPEYLSKKPGRSKKKFLVSLITLLAVAGAVAWWYQNNSKVAAPTKINQSENVYN